MQYTNPPKQCDLCSGKIGTVFYDFRTKSGQWANGCHACFRAHAGKLGVGLGQKYKKQADKNYWKEGTFDDTPKPAIGATLKQKRAMFTLNMQEKSRMDLTGVDPSNPMDRERLLEYGLSAEQIDALPPYESVEDVNDDPTFC